MECELSEPEQFGVRVEILPDLFVEMDTARRIHALFFVLLALIVLAALGPRFALRQALTHRPLLPAPVEALAPRPPPVAVLAGGRPASELRFLEGFARARKRALEVLQYAITTAPPLLRTRFVELTGDPAAPLDPGRFRLKIACAPSDPTVTKGFLENLRVLLPGAAVTTPEDADDGQVVIDSAAELTPAGDDAPALPMALAPESAEPEAEPEPAPLKSAPLSPSARLAAIPPPAPLQVQDSVLSAAPLGRSTFPRASAVPAPDHGRLVPLLTPPPASPGATPSPRASPRGATLEVDPQEMDADEPEDAQ